MVLLDLVVSPDLMALVVLLDQLDQMLHLGLELKVQEALRALKVNQEMMVQRDQTVKTVKTGDEENLEETVIQVETVSKDPRVHLVNLENLASVSLVKKESVV